ncbi:MAG: hypothetical protein AAGI11_07635 [Pseudomonadota bacterium]
MRDSERILTSQGRTDLATAVPRYLAALGKRGLPTPDRLVYSRWRRTAETARIINAGMGPLTMEQAEWLIPGSGIDDVAKAMDRHDDHNGGVTAEHWLLVSHQPLVSRLIDYLLGSYGEVPPLSPGGLCCLEASHCGAGVGTLKFWAMAPYYEVSL